MATLTELIALVTHGFTLDNKRYTLDRVANGLKQTGLNVVGWSWNRGNLDRYRVNPYALVFAIGENYLVAMSLEYYELALYIHTKQGHKVKVSLESNAVVSDMGQKAIAEVGINKTAVNLLIEYYTKLYSVKDTPMHLPLSKTAKTLLKNGIGYRNDNLSDVANPYIADIIVHEQRELGNMDIRETCHKLYSISEDNAIYNHFTNETVYGIWLTTKSGASMYKDKGVPLNKYRIPEDILILSDIGTEGVLIATKYRKRDLEID